MLKTEQIMINGRPFIRTVSDTYYITCDGQVYGEAIDPTDAMRIYSETQIPLPELDTNALDNTQLTELFKTMLGVGE